MQNTRYKLSMPKVQVWQRWMPAEELVRIPLGDGLNIRLKLQIGALQQKPFDGGLDMVTSYTLAEYLLRARSGGQSIKIYHCKTLALDGYTRLCTRIDATSRTLLFTPGGGKLRSAAEILAGRDLAFRQLVQLARPGVVVNLEQDGEDDDEAGHGSDAGKTERNFPPIPSYNILMFSLSPLVSLI